MAQQTKVSCVGCATHAPSAYYGGNKGSNGRGVRVKYEHHSGLDDGYAAPDEGGVVRTAITNATQSILKVMDCQITAATQPSTAPTVTNTSMANGAPPSTSITGTPAAGMWPTHLCMLRA